MRQRGDYNIRPAVLYEYSHVHESRASRSRCSIPGNWYLVHIIQAQNRLQNKRYGGLFHAQKILVSRDYLITRSTSRATPSSCDGEEAQFPHGTRILCHPARNLQCTRKSRKLLCPKPKVMPRFSVGGCCRTDGPRRARSCQMFHTIAAINAAWCRSLR